MLEEAIVELPDDEKETSPNFPNFFWSICQNEYNLCQGIKPLKESSSDFFYTEHCGGEEANSESVCQRSKHCLFVASLTKNCQCSVCGSFSLESETDEHLVDKTEPEVTEANEDKEEEILSRVIGKVVGLGPSVYSGMPKSERPIIEQYRKPNEMVSHFTSVQISDNRAVQTNPNQFERKKLLG